jgi:hypothetical protein
MIGLRFSFRRVRIVDPVSSARHRSVIRSMMNLLSIVLMLMAIILGWRAWDTSLKLTDQLELEQQASELVQAGDQPQKPSTQELRERALFRELQSVGVRLNVDWSARLSNVESTFANKATILNFRLDTQKAEMEVKGEVANPAELALLSKQLQDSPLFARVSRISKNSLGSDFTVLISWPK